MVVGIILVLIAPVLIYAVFFWAPGRKSRKEESRCACCGYTVPKDWRVCPNCLTYVKQPEDGDENA
jgi:predicted amidophosphoribosyltransferase